MLDIINLNLMITRNCNLACAHCMRGEAANEDITDEVLEKVFKPNMIIHLLQLNGGEVFSRPQLLTKIIDTIIRKRVILECVNIPTNGTLYTEKIEKELDRLNSYLVMCNMMTGTVATKCVNIDLSDDKYHGMELSRIKETNLELYMEYIRNIDRLRRSKYYAGLRTMFKLINAGRATSLDEPKSPVEFYPVFFFEEYTPIGKIMSISNVGIDINGTVCNTCGEMPPKKEAIYGNIFEENIENIIKRAGIGCASENDMIRKYQGYVLQTVNNGQGQRRG